MVHETDILFTITAALVAAAFAGHIATRLSLPPILGYLIAGIALGPFTPGPIADSAVASELAELGVILLMFGVGIHFSLKDLMAVQSIALPAALLQIILVGGIVVSVMTLWGWSLGTTLMLGLAISVSSTVIVVETLSERDELDTRHGRLAIGWLIAEDLIIVLALVLVPVLADVPEDETLLSGLGLPIGIALLKILILAAIMLIIGSRILPRLLVWAARTGPRELFMLTVLAIALGIAYGSAELFDVSFALGAFLAGLVISEAELSHQAAEDALPFQDAFAVLFFVSIGMLFDPKFLLDSPVLVVTIVLIIVIAKPILNILILAPFDLPVSSAGKVAASRAQIGEFSFVLASMGMALDIFDQEVVSLILSGAILSIALNPIVFTAVTRGLAFIGAAEPRTFIDDAYQEHQYEEGYVSEEFKIASAEFHEHAVILGYGRVGSIIGERLQQQDIPIIVVERDRWIVRKLRDRGIHAIAGDGSAQHILEHLHLPVASVLVLAIADPIRNRLTMDRVRAIAPELPVIIRTHSFEEGVHYEDIDHVSVLMGEHELAVEMARIALEQFDLPGMPAS